MRQISVGMIGFGTVGAGVAKILQENATLIERRVGARIVLKKIADIDLETDRGVRLKPGILTSRVEEVIDDPDIGIVMELIGGLTSYFSCPRFSFSACGQGALPHLAMDKLGSL